MSKHTEAIERDDIRLFFNACLCATSQREFYTEAQIQRLGLDFLHTYIRVNYRSFYVQMLKYPINDHNRARIIAQLLAHPPTPPLPIENELITAGLDVLPVHRVYKLFYELVKKRVNNRRTRQLMRQYIQRRNNLEFDLVKYRKLMRRILRHLHFPLTEEAHQFLFGAGWKNRRFTSPLFETYRQAHFQEKALYQLPYTVAEGLAGRLNIPRKRFLKGIGAQMTETERLKHQQQSLRQGVALDWEPAYHGLVTLMLYALSQPPKLRPALEGVLAAYFEKRPPPALPGRVAAILDNSYSASGSRERLRRPLATAMALDRYLQSGAEVYAGYWLYPPQDLWDYTARGPTNLAHPLLAALDWGPDLLLIVSDGYENFPAGGVDWVMQALKRYPLLPQLPQIVHLNPVWNPLDFQPRQLSTQIPTLGIREVESLPAILAFARALKTGAVADLLVGLNHV